jgi:peptide/nickel transport system substrate-binding protein
LRILGDEIDSIDPTYLDDLQQQVLVANTGYDGLVGFAHESGADGAAIVPDLATTLPQPTAGGRVYTFGVRSRVRWSTGAPVTVFDIRRGLERAILAHDPIGTDIAGTANCKPSACLVSGIAVNPSASTVTITLARPNGNFLDDLATTVSVPASTPLAEHDDRLVPSTGPYQVTSFIPGKLVVLARNRYFHQWSAAAQPAGYPDRIEWRVAYHAGKISSQPAVDAVAAGRADWADARLAAPASASLGSRYTSLAARFGTRLHETPAETIHGLTLNTRIPPFNDVRARRAVAFAVDRAAVAAAWDIPGAVTCQIVPPNFSGYRPYCPYTLLQSGGRTDVWRAPNVIAAQRLVTQSHTRGMTVTIYKPPLHTGALPLIVDALRDIGYRPRVVGFRGDWPDYLNFVADSRRKVQLGFYGWVTGDATAANLLSNYRCDAYQPATTNILNPAGFCDPKFDHLLDEANRVEASSLAKADDLWAQADRILVDEAPWVPLVTPTWVDVVSARVHNYTRSPILGMLYDQMWVR